MLTDLVGHYAWADDYSECGIELWTVAVIEGKTPDEVIRIYGGDPDASIGDHHFAQLADLQGDGVLEPMQYHAQVFNHGGYVVAIENGYAGNFPEIARRCSAGGGRFFAVYWAPNTNPQINQAIDGTVTAHFETYSGDKPYSGYPAPSWITNISVNLYQLRSTALALMEQEAGLAFDRDWLTEMRPTYRIPEPYLMFRDVEGAELP